MKEKDKTLKIDIPVVKLKKRPARFRWTRSALDAVVLLASGDTILGVSEKIGKSVRVIKRWLKNEEFANAVLEERGRVIKQIGHRSLSEITSVADRLLAKIRAILAKKRVSKEGLRKLQLFLREYREYRTMERLEVGDFDGLLPSYFKTIDGSATMTLREFIIKKGIKADESSLKNILDAIISKGYSYSNIPNIIRKEVSNGQNETFKGEGERDKKDDGRPLLGKRLKVSRESE